MSKKQKQLIIEAALRRMGVLRPGELSSTDNIVAATVELDALIADLHAPLSERLKFIFFNPATMSYRPVVELESKEKAA